MLRFRPSFPNWACLILLFTLLTSAVACTAKRPTLEETSLTPMPTEAPFIIDETTGPVVITFAAYEGDRQLYEPLMAEFHQQKPDIEVQFVALPGYTNQTQDAYANYPRILSTTADTSVIFSDGALSAPYFRDLTPLIEGDPTFYPADFWTAASSGCQDSDEHVLGIPASIMLRAIYFDAQAFDSAGLPYPAPGWTWADFRKDVATLAKKQSQTIRYGYAERSAGILLPAIEAALTKSGGQINADALQPVVQWYLDLTSAQAIRPPLDNNTPQFQDDWESLFQSTHRPAMWGGYFGETMPGSDFSAVMAYQEYSFAPYPVVAAGSRERSTPVSVHCLTISSGSLNPRAAWEWLDFFSHYWLVRDKNSPGAIAMVPGRISVAQTEEYLEKLPGEIQSMVRYILEQGGYVSGADAEMVYAVIKAVSKAAASEIDLVTALQELASQPSVSASTAGTPIVVATPKPTLAADSTVVDYYFCDLCGDSNGVKKFAEQYNQSHPEMTIQVSTSFDNWHDMQSLSNAFDCVTTRPVQAIWQSEDFVALDALFDAEDTAFRQDFDPALLDYFRRDGALVALPAASQPAIMVYNANLLAKRGIQPPAADWTFDTFVTLLIQAASMAEGDRSYGTIFEIHDDFLFDGRGVVWVDSETDPPTPRFDSPDVAAALAMVDEFKLALPVLLAPQESNPLAKDYQVSGTPSFCLVDERGKVRSSGYPGVEDLEWKKLVEAWERSTETVGQLVPSVE